MNDSDKPETQFHPLWALVLEINRRNDPPLFAYEPMPGLLRATNEPPLDPFVFTFRAEISIAALLLAEVIDGQGSPLDFEKHRELSQFLSASPLGIALTVSTLEARSRLKAWPGFCASLCLPGFFEALDGWCEIVPAGESDIATDASRLRSRSGNNPEADSYFLNKLLEDVQSKGIVAMDEAVKGWSRALEAKEASERRRRKGVQPRVDEIRDSISRLWISDALWCRDRSGILWHLWPDGKERDLKRITDSISKLGLSTVHRGEHGPSIEKAEASFWKALRD